MGNIISIGNHNKKYRMNSSRIYDLQGQVIKYFSSSSSSQDNYVRDPKDVFGEHIYQLGFPNLEDFIHRIPKKNALANFIMVSPKRETPVQCGYRYVVNVDPVKKGTVVDVINTEIENGHSTPLVHLQLDKPTSILWRFLHSFLWCLPQFSLLRTFQLDELQLENEYFRCLLLAKCINPCTKNLYANKDAAVGIHRGIQGDYNSCYMDSLLFTMFYKTSLFDIVLVRKSPDDDFASNTRHILRDHVVIPLRNELYCPADEVMKLRSHLQSVNDDIMGSFIDVEELLYLLLQDVLKEKEFINYEEGGEDFMHLMQIDNDDNSKVITVQSNFESSMKINGDLKFTCVPAPVLILGLPRSNGKLVHYDAVIPNLDLDIKKFLKPKSCHYCKKLGLWEFSDESGLYVMCPSCVGYSSNKLLISRHSMKLQAVICIRASHFVTFVRNGRTSEWLFFDSMAGGYPEVKFVKKFEQWLNSVGNNLINYDNDKIPLLVQRAFTDGHFCIYEPVKFKK